MLGKGHGGLYKAPTKEERRKQNFKRERDQINFIDLRFERRQNIGFRKAREGKTFHQLNVLGMNDDLWDKVRGYVFL